MKLNKLLILLGLILAFPSSAKIEPSNNQVIGDGQASDKKITFNRGGSNPGFKWDEAAGEMKFTNDGSSYTSFSAAAGAMKNYLLNSNFQFWEWGTSTTITDGNAAYQAERWYVKNSLGTNGVITYSQVAGVSDGAPFGAKVQITTAPTAAQNNGTELYQTLENIDSLELYNQTASFSVKVKALNNVTQVGLQFMYKTTEAKVDTTIGSESLCTVNSSTFSNCSIAGQALGTSMTTSGVVGVRIRITAVSSGDTWDLNNGYTVELAMLNKGVAAGSYQLRSNSVAAEHLSLMRYYECFRDPSDLYSNENSVATAGFNESMFLYYKARKRIVPTGSIVGTWTTNNASGQPTLAGVSVNRAALVVSSSGTGNTYFISNNDPTYVCFDAEIQVICAEKQDSPDPPRCPAFV